MTSSRRQNDGALRLPEMPNPTDSATASRIRLIALDLDGTVLNSSAEIPDANLRAIQAAVDAGIEVAIVTGRRFDFARPVAEQNPRQLTMIVNNGALVRSKDGTTHLRHLLPRQTALTLLGEMEIW